MNTVEVCLYAGGILSIPLGLHLLKYIFLKKEFFYWVEGKDRRLFLKKQQMLFGSLFAYTNAFAVSMQEQRRLGLGSSYIYGEVLFPSFVFLLDQARPLPGEKFYDLGCGLGKALAVAALCYSFEKVVGIEALEPLQQLASQKIYRLNTFSPLKTRPVIIRGGFL